MAAIAEVMPLHQTQADHSTLLTLLAKIHGVSPSAVLDSSNRQFTEAAKAVIQLSAAEGQHPNAVKALQNSHAVQRHFHYSFLVISQPGVFEEVMLLNTGLALTLAYHDFDRPVYIISGTLAEWRDAVAVGCGEAATTDLRYVFNKLSLWFEKLGLGEVWAAYHRYSMPDGTFRLEGPKNGR